MKTLFRVTIAILSVILFTNNIQATTNPDQLVPMDTAIRYGVLPNGLTYYIRHNSEPKNRADFYIAQKVGSILENEEQLGLAHFLEHMAFNGTNHFPNKELINYLEKNGIRFGADINAYTSFDETVYNINNIPTTNHQLMDSVLIAIYDWAGGLLLTEEEIDNERGVIVEEWRTRSSAQMRMYESILPIIYEGSQYANRLPIGDMDIVRNFEPQVLRDYYHKWYRPDNQGIIIVGDFNADDMEQKVIELFSTLQMPENPAPRTYYPVPDNKEPIYAIYKDSEASSTNIMLFFKHDVTPLEERKTIQTYRNDILDIIGQVMMNTRFYELTQNAEAPFTRAYGYNGDFFVSATKNAFSLMAIAKENKNLETLSALLNQVQQIKQHGFTQTELDRTKGIIETSIRNQYLERNKQRSQSLATSYANDFTSGNYTSSIEYDYETIGKLLTEITLDEINNHYQALITEENIVTVISGADDEKIIYPSEETVLTTISTILNSETTAYIDNTINTPLVRKEPVAGKIISEGINEELDMTILTLSNGATVYLKPTTLKNDQILFKAISTGGKWSYKGDETKALDLKTFNSALDYVSFGDYDLTNLIKYLSDKKISLTLALNDATESLQGSSSIKDFETLMQLVYVTYTDIQPDTAAFKTFKEKLRSNLAMRNNNPNAIFSDSITATLYNHNPNFTSVTLDDIDNIDYENILHLKDERFSNAGDFGFIFIGNFDIDSIKPLIEKYIASLPDNGIREEIDYKTYIEVGKIENHFEQPMQTPKTSIYSIISGDGEYTLKNNLMINILSNIMRIVYTNTIREEEGGTYGVSVSSSLSKYNNKWNFKYSFDTNQEQQAKLSERTFAEFKTVIENGANEIEFNKVKESLINNYENSIRENNYWLNILSDYAIGFNTHTYYEQILREITLEEFNAYIKMLNITENQITIKMIGK